MSAAALARPASDAQREAARRNGARSHGPQSAPGKVHSSRNAPCGAHTLVCGAKLHLFTPEETEALREQTQYFIESFRPADPVALATFQMRRITQIEIDFEARNPRDSLALTRLLHALGAIDTRYQLLRHRCLRRLDQIATKNEANEPGILLKQKVAPASAGGLIHHFFPSPVPAEALARQAEVGV